MSREVQLCSAWSRCEPVERVAGISRRDFERRFLESHGGEGRPVIVEDAMARWPARSRWSLEFFARQFGELPIRAYCRSSRRPPYAAAGFELSLRDYIDYCRHGELRAPPPDGRALTEQTELPEGAGPLYYYENLGRPEYARLFDDFAVDLYFVDNLQARMRAEWSRLTFHLPFANLFIGPRGTCVDLHKDYWSSHTIIAHFEGEKHAVSFAPSDAPHLFNARREPLDPRAVDRAEFPHFDRALPFVATLRPGDMLFLPPNWYHDVLGLSPTLSLGMNIFSVHNFGEYMPNLLAHAEPILEVLRKHPTLRHELAEMPRSRELEVR